MKLIKWILRLVDRKCKCGGIKEDIYYDAETNLINEKCKKCGNENLH